MLFSGAEHYARPPGITLIFSQTQILPLCARRRIYRLRDAYLIAGGRDEY